MDTNKPFNPDELAEQYRISAKEDTDLKEDFKYIDMEGWDDDDDNEPVKKPSHYFGTLSLEEGEKLQDYITQSRKEWERDIDESEATKEEILAKIKQGFEEAKLISEGKLKCWPIQDLLDEL